MRTEDLVRAMSVDATPVRPVEVMLPLALLAGLIAAAPIMAVIMGGVRPVLADALMTAPVLLKQAFPVVMAVAAFGAVARLARPEARVGGWGWALMLAPAIALVAFWSTAATTPVPDWRAAILGRTALDCFLTISFLGTLLLAGALGALRRGATTQPRLSGALAGLLSASAAAGLFTFFCTEDSPMFWGVWYVLAIGVVTGIGALLGKRRLRW